MAPNKFLHLKELSISIRGWSSNQEYDFLSLVSFLDASPSLENFDLFVSHCSSCNGFLITGVKSLTQICRPFTFQISVSVESKYDLFVGDPSTLRQMREHHHETLKLVKITRFCPQKSLVELTRHILESAMSLKCLILDTTNVTYRCYGNIRARKFSSLVSPNIREAHEALLAVKTYIEGKVPSTVQLDVLEPCSRCHAL